MKVSIDTIARERVLLAYERLRSLVAEPADAPLFVFGNQKSGTSAVAAILGFSVGLPVKVDFAGAREPMLSRVVLGRQSIADFVRRNAWAFSYPIVKEPGLTSIAVGLLDHFGAARGVFVVRDPWANIRSVCNRLGLDGRAVRVPPGIRLNATWRSLLAGGRRGERPANPVESLALRWRETADVYLSNTDRFVLVRYEDFCEDKVGEVRRVAHQCGLDPHVDVSREQLDTQYQPRGNKRIDPTTFFGPDHFDLIDRICSETAREFGYRAAATSAAGPGTGG